MKKITQFVDLTSQYKILKGEIDARIESVLKHGKYILGPEVSELECALADYCGVEHAIGVSDGSMALLIALLAAGVEAGDEVITTPFTFFATAEMIVLAGAQPVFVDIRPDDFNIDPSLVERAITSKTKAVIAVSLFGQCAALDVLHSVATTYGLSLIEDGAQSFGASRFGSKSGSFGTIGTTSFFPSKPLGCYGDGGACFTNDPDLAKFIRTLRDHGQSARYQHDRIGVNGRLDTIQAGILLAKLPHFDAEILRRQAIADRYDRALASMLITPRVSPGNRHVYAQYTVRVESRSAFCAQLDEHGIPTAIHYPTPLHLQPAFKFLGHHRGDFPAAELAADQVVSLPIHPYLDAETQDKIISAVMSVID